MPAGPINDIAEVMADPQVRHESLIVPLPHPRIPELEVAGVPIGLSETPGSVRTPPPALGEHTASILAQLGMPSSRIAELEAQGVIRCGERTG